MGSDRQARWGLAAVVFPALAGIALLGALYLVFMVAPTEREMGIVQKIFYFHVPSAIAMGALFVLCGVSSLVYLVQPDRRVDAVAASAAEIAVLLGAIVLITGPLWARKAWGTYWTWEPRLTLTLLTVFVYASYLAVRAWAGPPAVGRKVAAALGVIGLPAYYFIKVAVDRWGGNHPENVVYGEGQGLIHPDMRLAFFVALGATFALATLLVALRARLHGLEHRIEALREEMSEYDLLEDAR